MRIDTNLDRTPACFPDHRYPFSSYHNCLSWFRASSWETSCPKLSTTVLPLHPLATAQFWRKEYFRPSRWRVGRDWLRSNYVQWKFPRAIYVTLCCMSCLSPLPLKTLIRKFCSNLPPTRICRVRTNELLSIMLLSS